MSDAPVIVHGTNGNVEITIHADGTRIIDYPGKDPSVIDLAYPLNVDLKVSSRCMFGYDPRTRKAVCDFCHESARTDGTECDYDHLERVLADLPLTTEIALGINEVTDGLVEFLTSMHAQGRIINGTFNQGLVKTGRHRRITDKRLLKGVGISWRRGAWGTDDPIYRHPDTVLHVIAGIDNFDEVLETVTSAGIKKVLVLGEKNFGFNHGRVDLSSPGHRAWYTRLHELFAHALVSFDNLGLEQLNVRRYFRAANWDVFHQGERSIYLDAVKKTFAPSSRSPETTSWHHTSLKDYWQSRQAILLAA